MAPPPSDRLSLRLDRALARLGGTALIPVLLLALACAGPIGGVALARISMASAYGKANGQTTGALRAWSLSWGRSPGAPGDGPHLSRVVRTNGGDRDPPRAADG
jgi:hypothetical protein